MRLVLVAALVATAALGWWVDDALSGSEARVPVLLGPIACIGCGPESAVRVTPASMSARANERTLVCLFCVGVPAVDKRQQGTAFAKQGDYLGVPVCGGALALTRVRATAWTFAVPPFFWINDSNIDADVTAIRAGGGGMRGLALIAALSLAGCAGARVSVSADRAAYPISLSPLVGDGNGKLWKRSELVKVGTLSAQRTSLGFAYTGLTPRSRIDVSEEVNAQVTAAGGEAVVGVTITVAGTCGALNAFPILPILPVWPGCVPVVVSGDIVKRPAAPPAVQPGLRPLAAAPTTPTANTRPLK